MEHLKEIYVKGHAEFQGRRFQGPALCVEQTTTQVAGAPVRWAKATWAACIVS